MKTIKTLVAIAAISAISSLSYGQENGCSFSMDSSTNYWKTSVEGKMISHAVVVDGIEKTGTMQNDLFVASDGGQSFKKGRKTAELNNKYKRHVYFEVCR